MSSKPFCKFLGLEGNGKSNDVGESCEASSQKSPVTTKRDSYMEAEDDRSLEVISQIEDIVLSILLAIRNGDPPRVRFFNRHIWQNTSLENMVIKGTGNTNVTVDFGQPQSRAHMALILWLLSTLHHQIISGSASTKRELFYKSLGTLQSLGYSPSQTIVDSAMSDVGALLDLPPRLLGVLPSSRGLVAGDLQVSCVMNSKSSASSLVLDTTALRSECCPIPGDIASIPYDKALVKSSAQLVLIIEKDASFQKLLDDGILEHLKPCLLITGRGYPDVCTRRLVHMIWKCLGIPILALVDADPHGIEIMLVYRFGSRAMSKDAEELAVPSIKWLGIHPSDIPSLGLPANSVLPLGREGNAKAEALLARPYVQAHPCIHREVAAMIKFQCKAEIEALQLISSTYVTDVYIPGKIATKKAI